jgi:hypothetical protein
MKTIEIEKKTTRGKKISNFFHNAINLTHSLFGTGVIVAGIVLCALSILPILPAICYGILALIVGSMLFAAAHRVVNFFSHLFNDPKKLDGSLNKVVAPKVTQEKGATSTHQINTTLTQHAQPATAAKPITAATVVPFKSKVAQTPVESTATQTATASM